MDRHLKPVFGASVEALDPRRLQDYGYVDARGMGVRNKMIPGMRAHNGTGPDLIEEEHRFIVRLWKQAGAGWDGRTGEPGIGLRSAGKRDRGRIR